MAAGRDGADQLLAGGVPGQGWEEAVAPCSLGTGSACQILVVFFSSCHHPYPSQLVLLKGKRKLLK